MKTKKQEQRIKHRIAPFVTEKEELHKYEESFKRWLAEEFANKRLTIQEAVKKFSLPSNFVWKVAKTYAGQVAITLPVMTEAEKKKLEKQQQRIKELEKQLEDAQVRNIALNMYNAVAGYCDQSTDSTDSLPAFAPALLIFFHAGSSNYKGS